jgi:hypothetical protein
MLEENTVFLTVVFSYLLLKQSKKIIGVSEII